MYRGDIWVTNNGQDAYILIGSDHLAHNRDRPPIAWGIPITAEAQPKKFTHPFVVNLTPTATSLEFPTWALIARGITPLRQSDLTTKIGALNPSASERITDAVTLLYDLD